jgi:hypothetical protein
MKYTVMVPVFGHVNWTHVALHALRRNAVYPPKIVVAWSDPRVSRKGVWQGEHGNWDGGPFEDMQAFIEHHKAWLDDNEVTVVDLTERCLKFRQQCEQGKVHGCRKFDDGCDIAFKNNVSMDYVDTDWCVPNWDADFHPGPEWDRPLVDYIESHPEPAVLIPTHVQPTTDVRARDVGNAWEDTRRIIAGNRLALYWPEKVVPESAFFSFCQKWSRNDTFSERCGERGRLHWVPTMVPSDAVRRLQYSYKGSGYDVDFDDRLGGILGLRKIGFMDSFILHKGYVPLEQGHCLV